MKIFIKLFFSLTIACLICSTVNAQVSFEKADLKTNKKYSCLLINGVWEPGKVSRSLFYSEAGTIDTLTARLNAETDRRKKRRLLTSINAAKTRRSRAIKNYCGKLVVPETAAITSLSKIPNSSKIFSASGASLSTVSGTPPTVVSMNSLALKNVFWNSGVIDAIIGNTANESQCRQFYSTLTDGSSGGFDACYTAQDVASTISDVVGSGTTLCYMRNIANATNVANGSLSTVLGSFPSNDPAQLFSIPSGSTSRLIQIRVGGLGDGPPEDGFYIAIKSSGENAAAGNQYSYTAYSCEGSGSTPVEIEETSVKTDNRYVSDILTSGEHSFNAAIRAYLTETDGVVSFDSTRDKTVQMNLSQGTSSFKGDMTITPSNYIIAKRYGIFPSEIFKAYSVSRYSASSLGTLRFLESAFQRSSSYDAGVSFNNTTSAVEYQDTNYKVSASNVFLPWLTAVDFAVDSFYNTVPSVPAITTSFNCNTVVPDLVVSVNMATETMRAVSATCEGERLRDVNFCQNDSDLNAASNNFNAACGSFLP